MKAFVRYVKEFIKEDFHFLSYGYTALFLVFFIVLNYTIEIEDVYIDEAPQEQRIGLYFIFYCLAWFGTAIPILILRKEIKLLRSYKWWLLAALFILLLSIDAGFYHHRIWLSGIENRWDQAFARKIFVNVFSIGLYIVTFYWIRKYLIKSNSDYAFGLLKPTPQWKSYLMLWGIMLPLLLWASFQPDFTQQYPEFKPWKYPSLFGADAWNWVPLYEICYALDFVAVEWLFRGALVIGMAHFLGRHAILPMVACYAFLHFGKPAAETIGSVFGGYILGILALRTTSIWGGCLVHIGIALTMDMLAIGQYLKNE